MEQPVLQAISPPVKRKLTRLAGRMNAFFARSNPIVLISNMDASAQVMINDTATERSRSPAFAVDPVN